MNSIRIKLAAALAVAEIADIISSYATPGQELNPIMAAMMAAIGPHLWWVPKMAIVAAICVLMLKSRRWAIPITCTVVAAIAPIWNVVRLVLQ
jgi:Na+-translocating ferredoxin:NAD+ oxidoreductase RnfD subunit